MNTSKFLSKVIGLYLILVSLVMMSNIERFMHLVDGMIHNPPLMFALGFVILILGLLMVLSHNVWQWNWRVLVTLIGWMVFLKGACILFAPHWMDTLSQHFISNPGFAHLAATVDLALGLALSYFGFKR